MTISRLELLNFVYFYLAGLGLCCCARAFSSCGEQGLLSVWGARASHSGDFSCCCSRTLSTWASVVMAHGLSCPDACGILVPRPGIEPTSPALAGGFITTGPPASVLMTAFMQRICAFWGLGETPAKAQATWTKQIDSDGALAACQPRGHWCQDECPGDRLGSALTQGFSPMGPPCDAGAHSISVFSPGEREHWPRGHPGFLPL